MQWFLMKILNVLLPIFTIISLYPTFSWNYIVTLFFFHFFLITNITRVLNFCGYQNPNFYGYLLYCLINHLPSMIYVHDRFCVAQLNIIAV